MTSEEWEIWSTAALLPGDGKPGSPIENAFYRAFCYVISGVPASSRTPNIECQVDIAGFRVDFVCGRGLPHQVVVECDGHDFHERTKEQATKDKARDRQLLALGFPVMRFTGTEIFMQPLVCALSVVAQVMGANNHAQ